MRLLRTAFRWSSVLACLAGCDAGSTTGDAGRQDVTRVDRFGVDSAGTDTGGDAAAPFDLVVIAPSTPADAATHFTGTPVTDPARAATIVYPLDRVVFPRNVTPPDAQWEGPGRMGDLYRVRIVGPGGTVTAYVAHTGASFRNDYVIDATAWRTLASSSGGRDMTLTIDRWDSMADQVIAGSPVHMHFARGSIAGAVYYWTLGSFGGTEGRIVRVMQGTDVPPAVENFMPNPPPAADGTRCAACHGLSRDGNRLAISIGDGEFGGVYDTTRDLTGPNPPAVFLFTDAWYFAAFNNDASRVLVTDPAQTTMLLNGTTGARITPSSGALPALTHPAWSPDGRLVAGIRRADDAWNPTRGDLVAIDAMAGDTFGAPRALHSGADLASNPEGGSLDAYPSFSPDNRLIAFQHGNHTLLSAAGARGALYVMTASGGAPVRLNRASGGASTSDGWYPNFTPFLTPDDDTGSVYWLLLYSQRDYGNAQAGTKGTHRRQIWVTAVSSDLSGHPDPSYVPYWLPGQDVRQENASAFWAPRPCRANGGPCEGDGQCCSGNCTVLAAMTAVCSPPPTSNCRHEGQSCGSDGDCCGDGLQCAGGVCLLTPG